MGRGKGSEILGDWEILIPRVIFTKNLGVKKKIIEKD